MAESRAILSNYRQAPRKVRLVADLVRGKSASKALALLSVLPKRASEPMQKLIKSAISNATKSGDSVDTLFISRIEVNGGIVFKRQMPRARGKASMIRKRTSHISISLSTKTPKKEKVASK